jgi:putative FmdB family regulatory protein
MKPGVASSHLIPHQNKLIKRKIMPLYEYECTACHKHTEKIQKFSDPEITVCPHCGGKLERVLSAPAVSFKGGGWYADGYGNAKPKSTGDSGSTGNGSKPATDSKSSSDSAPSKDSASAAAPAAPAAASAPSSSSDKK